MSPKPFMVPVLPRPWLRDGVAEPSQTSLQLEEEERC